MSNNESFIDEVTEEVRKDQLFGYLRKYGWIAVLVVVVVVGGTAYTEFRKSQTENAARATGNAMLAALEIDDDADRAAALAAIDVDGAAAAVAGLLAAADLQEVGDIVGAAAALDAVALNQDAPEVYRDLAALKSAMVQAATLSPDDRRARLNGLAQPGAPFRLLAEEQLAYLDFAEGDVTAALDRFTAIAQDAEATQGLRERAFSMIVALGGELADIFGAPAQADDQ